MILVRNFKILVPPPISEADIGRTSYWDVNYRVMRLECELLVAEDELTVYEEEVGISEFPEAVEAAGAPFYSWEDLINAVRERTPQAKALKRYLEANPYHKVLRKKVTETTEEGEAVTKLGPFILDPDELEEVNVKAMHAFEKAKEEGRPAVKFYARKKGGKGDSPTYVDTIVSDKTSDDPNAEQYVVCSTPSVYNRYWFSQLLKFAPRAMAPEAHGGQKVIKRGSQGSPKWAQEVRAPLVPIIVEDHVNEIQAEIRRIFSPLGEQWENTLLGPNNKNVRVIIDKGAEHLARLISPTPREGLTALVGTDDYKLLAHLKRTKDILSSMSKSSSADRVRLRKAMTQIDREMDKVASKNQEPQYKIYIHVDIAMKNFIVGLTREISNLTPEPFGEGTMEIKTSLSGVNAFLRTLDPTSHLGMRGDFFKIIEMAIDNAQHVSSEVRSITNGGAIIYRAGKTPIEFAREMGEYE